MSDSVTICIGTIGSPTFERCKKIIDSIAARDPRVKKVVVISNKSPQSAWLNLMRGECVDTKWCLQIDEDMYLHQNALNKLLKFANEKEKEGVKILSASSLLYDLFLRQNIGSLKLWSSEALQSQEFRDVLGGDRDYAKRAKKNGFRNVEISVVLGSHDSAPSEKIAYKKYFEYVQKIRKFKGESSAKSFVKWMKKKHVRENTKITRAAYSGSKSGLHSHIVDRSKKDVDLEVESYLHNIFSSDNPGEVFSRSKNSVKKLLSKEAHSLKVFLNILKSRWAESGEFIDKKAYDGAKRAAKQYLQDKV